MVNREAMVDESSVYFVDMPADTELRFKFATIDGAHIVNYVAPDGAAFAGGVCVGDTLERANSISLARLDHDTAVAQIRSLHASGRGTVTLAFTRGGNEA